MVGEWLETALHTSAWWEAGLSEEGSLWMFCLSGLISNPALWSSDLNLPGKHSLSWVNPKGHFVCIHG